VYAQRHAAVVNDGKRAEAEATRGEQQAAIMSSMMEMVREVMLSRATPQPQPQPQPPSASTSPPPQL